MNRVEDAVRGAQAVSSWLGSEQDQPGSIMDVWVSASVDGIALSDAAFWCRWSRPLADRPFVTGMTVLGRLSTERTLAPGDRIRAEIENATRTKVCSLSGMVRTARDPIGGRLIIDLHSKDAIAVARALDVPL